MKSKLMLIEDEDQQREVLTMLLESEGYEVIPAESAERALDLLKLSTPDMIVTDVKLPGTDGFTLYDVVRDQMKLSKIPFLFITGYNDPASIARVRDLGAFGYVTKPYNLEALMQMVREKLPPG